jgi:hypothetical protein
MSLRVKRENPKMTDSTTQQMEFYHVYGIRCYGGSTVTDAGDCEEVLLCTLVGEEAAVNYINMMRNSSGANYDDFYYVKATSRFVSL